MTFIDLFSIDDLAADQNAKAARIRRHRHKLPRPSITLPGGHGQSLWTAPRLRSGGIRVPEKASITLDLS